MSKIKYLYLLLLERNNDKKIKVTKIGTINGPIKKKISQYENKNFNDINNLEKWDAVKILEIIKCDDMCGLLENDIMCVFSTLFNIYENINENSKTKYYLVKNREELKKQRKIFNEKVYLKELHNFTKIRDYEANYFSNNKDEKNDDCIIGEKSNKNLLNPFDSICLLLDIGLTI